jgi:aldose 1-epimerase
MATSAVNITSRAWGIAPDGSAVQSFRLTNGLLTLELLSFGGRVAALHVPDRDGNIADVVLGYNALEHYMEDTAFLGCTVGRYANRIAAGQFSLDGESYQLPRNNGPNTLHGGPTGFWNRNWDSQVLADGVEFRVASPDGDGGFPGQVEVVARFRLEDNQVVMEYEATTDKLTVLNLTNHAYFNLAGEGSTTVLDQQMQIEADAFTPINEDAIPTGGDQPVHGTPFDFLVPHAIGERIHETHPQLVSGKGYDHNFVLKGEGLRRAARAEHTASGRSLEVWTTEPGVQFYSGNYLDGSTVGKGGSPYTFRSGFCLETQHFPDSPNHPEFPSTELKPGVTFRSSTVWKFNER